MSNEQSRVFALVLSAIEIEKAEQARAQDAQARKYHVRKEAGFRVALTKLGRSRNLKAVEAELRQATHNFVGPFADALGIAANFAASELAGGGA